MPTAQLTGVSIRALKPPKSGQVTYLDKTLTGFGIRVSQGGTKSFVVVYGANRQRTTIGKFPTVTLGGARTEAKRLLAEYTLGKTKYPSITFEEAQSRFLERCRQRNRPKTVKDYEWLLNRHFRFGRVRLSDITQHDVMRRVNQLRKTPKQQNYAFSTIRTLFRWAVRNNYLESNPLENLRPPAVIHSRERVLTDRELKKVYSNALEYGHLYGHIVSLLILTGQRRGEIGALQWGWIDQDEKSITIPATFTKNKRTHIFPYGTTAQKVLDSIPKTGIYLFPAGRSNVRGKPTTIFSGWSKAKRVFDTQIEGVEPYTLHDLRRTFSSTLASLSTPLHVTEKLLNHVSGSLGGVAGIYNRYSYMDEMREAMFSYEKHLQQLVES